MGIQESFPDSLGGIVFSRICQSKRQIFFSSALLRANQVAGAALHQIHLRNLKTVVVLTKRRKAFIVSIFRYEYAGTGVFAAANASSQLVQLRKAEAFRVMGTERFPMLQARQANAGCIPFPVCQPFLLVRIPSSL